MKRYASILGSSSSTVMGAKRAADIVAALAPPAKPNVALVKPDDKPKESVGSIVMSLVPGAVGGLAGYMLWHKHPVLGALGGFALGFNAMGVYKGGAERTRALGRLGVDAAGIGAALMWKKHPVWGWIGGKLAGTIASSFVSGTVAHDELAAIKAKLGK
jgi:hypothetical protein